MRTIEFKEAETFKTPDGQEWVVKKLRTKVMKDKISLFIDYQNEMTQYQENNDNYNTNKLIYDKITPLCDEIIDEGIADIEYFNEMKQYKRLSDIEKESIHKPIKKNFVKLEDEYVTIKTKIDIVTAIIEATTGMSGDNKGDGTPLRENSSEDKSKDSPIS